MLANCCLLGRISNMTTHVIVLRNLSRVSPELTTTYKSVGMGLLLFANSGC